MGDWLFPPVPKAPQRIGANSWQRAYSPPNMHGWRNHFAFETSFVAASYEPRWSKSLSKTRFRELCNNEPDIPIFLRDWWLDACVGPANWDVAVVDKGGSIVAALPYTLHTDRYGLHLVQPALTPYLGPWIKKMPGKTVTTLKHEHACLEGLEKGLPRSASYRQRWQHRRHNWLPLFWKKYSQSTRYTYRLEDVSDLESVWAGMKENLRREIRKATNRNGLIVSSAEEVEPLWELHQQVYSRQGRNVPYPREFFLDVANASIEKGMGVLMYVQNSSGDRVAGVLLVWDNHSCYYLVGGLDNNHRNSGAMTLLLWKCIGFASRMSLAFDFEGSMVKGIEGFFRSFGATPTQYFEIEKTFSKSLRIRNALVEVIKCLK